MPENISWFLCGYVIGAVAVLVVSALWRRNCNDEEDPPDCTKYVPRGAKQTDESADS